MTDTNNIKNKNNRFLIAAAVFAAEVLFAAGSAVNYNLIFIAAAGACSAWLTYTENIFVGLLPVVPAYIAGYFITNSFLAAVISATFVPIGIFFACVSLKKFSRSTASAISGAVTATIIIAATCIKTYISQGGIGIDEIRNSFSELFDMFGTILSKSTTVTVAGNETSYITAENVDAYINTFICLLPGCIVLISTMTAYISGFLYRLLLKLTGNAIPDKSVWRVVPSPVTTVFFVVSTVSSFVIPSAGIVWLAVVNFSMILVSGLEISGLNSITEIKIIDNMPHIPIFRMIISIISLLFGGIGTLLIFALLCGVTDSIAGIFRKENKSL